MASGSSGDSGNSDLRGGGEGRGQRASPNPKPSFGRQRLLNSIDLNALSNGGTFFEFEAGTQDINDFVETSCGEASSLLFNGGNASGGTGAGAPTPPPTQVPSQKGPLTMSGRLGTTGGSGSVLKKGFRPLCGPNGQSSRQSATPLTPDPLTREHTFTVIGSLTLPINNFQKDLSRYNFRDLTGDGGIRKCVRRVGKMHEYMTPNDLVWINYKMIIENQDEPIFVTPEPLKFQRGQPDVMGWLDDCVGQMTIGEISYFLVSSKYAYGELGMWSIVPPGATVLFEVELIHFMEAPAHSTKDICDMTQTEICELKVDEITRFIRTIKYQAKLHIDMENWDKAILRYHDGLRVLESYFAKEKDEKVVVEQLIFDLYNNMTLCSLKNGWFEDALEYGKKCLDLEVPKNTPVNFAKIYYRLASAEFAVGNIERAFDWIQKARKLKPTDKDILKLGYKIHDEMNVREKELKELYTKMSKMFKEK